MHKHLPRIAALAAVATMAVGAMGADHVDAPATTNEPGADITDLYTWMSPDAKTVRIALDVSPFAVATTKFSDAVQYAIHVKSAVNNSSATHSDTDIICEFSASQQIECWVGASEYVTGDASSTAGISSASGKVKVFAGMRNDPFFFALDGFKAAVAAIEGTPITIPTSGCPSIGSSVSSALVGLLQSDGKGGPAKDTFAGANVLAIVLEVDKTLLTSGGAVLGVWASTHRKS
jgi:hypothetical protein